MTTQQQAKLSVTSSASGLMVEGDLTITISPFPVWTPTAAQQALIDGYRAKGIDLSTILGYHTVEGTVDWAGFTDYDYGTISVRRPPGASAVPRCSSS